MSKDPEENPIPAVKAYQMKQPVKKLYVSPDGLLLVSSSADNRLRVWDIDPKSGELTPTHTFKGHSGPPTKMRIEKNLLISLSSRDEVLRTWNLTTKELVTEFKGHEKYLTDFVLLMKEELIYTSSFDQTIICWNLKNGEKKQQFVGHTDSITSIKVVGNHIVSCAADRTIRIWNRKTAECEKVLTGHTNFIFGLHIQDKMIYSHSQDGTVRIFDLKTGELQTTIEFGAPVMKMKLTKKGIFAQGSKVVKFYTLAGKESEEFEGHTSSILCFAWYKNYMFTGAADRTIRSWNCKRGKVVGVFRGHAGPANSLVIRDNFFYSAGQDGSIRQWSNTIYLKEEVQGWV